MSDAETTSAAKGADAHATDERTPEGRKELPAAVWALIALLVVLAALVTLAWLPRVD